MKVSIITAAYNAAATIADTIRSVAAQDHDDIEHIIVDGASSDATVSVARQHSSSQVQIISEPDKGLYDAMNKGLKAAKGDLLGFLNADDFFCRKDAVSMLVAKARQSKCAAVIGGVAIVNDNNLRVVRRAYSSTSFAPWMLRFGHMPPHPGFYMTRYARDMVGLFDDSLRIGGDLEWMIRFYLVNHMASTTIPETIVSFRQGGISTRGLASTLLINQEALLSLQRNGIWTLKPMMILKYLPKMLQFVTSGYQYPPPPEIAWFPKS